jgi:predicted nucleic acid-binding protein
MPDDHSTAAAAQVTRHPDALLVSSLVMLEMTNAMHLRVFRKQRTPRQAAESIGAFETDLSDGIFRLLPVPQAAWATAQKLSRTHSAQLGSRSLDILQVAIAIVLRADTFLTFDRNQAALAEAAGLLTA